MDIDSGVGKPSIDGSVWLQVRARVKSIDTGAGRGAYPPNQPIGNRRGSLSIVREDLVEVDFSRPEGLTGTWERESNEDQPALTRGK